MNSNITKTKQEMLQFDLQTKIQVLTTLTIIGSVTLLLYCAVNIFFGMILTGILDGIVAVLLIINLFVLKKWKFFSLAGDLVLALMLGLFVYLFFVGGYYNTGILWLYTYPIMSYFLRGKKAGSVWAFIFIVAIVGSFLISKLLVIPLPYNDQFLVVFILSMAVVTGVTFFYEAILTSRQDVLFEKTDRLDQLNESLRFLSDHDSLTKCSNRRKILEQIKIEIPRSFRYNSQCSVMLVDFDHFKSINDNYGHLFGDYVLKEAIRIIKEKVLRAVDCIGRYGGEEFLILLPSTNLAGAKAGAERIRSSVKMKNFYHAEMDCFVPVTVSVGVTMVYGQEDIDNILLRADKALYKAKENGRDRVEIYDPNLSGQEEKKPVRNIFPIPHHPTSL